MIQSSPHESILSQQLNIDDELETNVDGVHLNAAGSCLARANNPPLDFIAPPTRRTKVVAQVNPAVIQVAMAANRNYFHGLAATLTSLLRSNQNNTFRIHIIDGGLSGFQKRFLAKRVARAGRDNRLEFHPLNAASFTGFKPDYGNSYMTYARMLVGSLLDVERVIYLDTDLLVAADVKPLWEAPLKDCIVAAVPDPTISCLRDDYPFDGDGGDARYFNAGVMVIDLVAWRRANAEDKLLRMIAAAPARFRWWDQTAMNALFEKQILFLDSSWNTFADSIDLHREDQRGIFHYAGKTKPWTRYLDSVEFRVWREFFGRHVFPHALLLLNGKFLRSYLQFRRHRMLNRNSGLQRLALGILSVKARIQGKDHSIEIIRFRKRHADHTATDSRGNHLSPDALKRFVEQRWD